MKLRIFIYKPGESIRQSLSEYLESFGHDVVVINLPQTCLQYHSPENVCSEIKICADMIIIGTDISQEDGLLMLERRMKAGCRGAKNNSIICSELTDDNRIRAEKIGCTCFNVPLDLEEVGRWLAEVEQNVDHQRELSSFTIGSSAT